MSFIIELIAGVLFDVAATVPRVAASIIVGAGVGLYWAGGQGALIGAIAGLVFGLIWAVVHGWLDGTDAKF